MAFKIFKSKKLPGDWFLAGEWCLFPLFPRWFPLPLPRFPRSLPGGGATLFCHLGMFRCSSCWANVSFASETLLSVTLPPLSATLVFILCLLISASTRVSPDAVFFEIKIVSRQASICPSETGAFPGKFPSIEFDISETLQLQKALLCPKICTQNLVFLLGASTGPNKGLEGDAQTGQKHVAPIVVFLCQDFVQIC